MCSRCEKLEDKIESAKDFFCGVVAMMYGKMPYDQEQIDAWMQEIGHYLEVKIPNNLPIQK